MSNSISFLRYVALIEAISFLLLLGIAMPMKYAWGKPAAVTIAGWIHGALFVVFVLALARVWFKARWPAGRVLLVFIAALLPFGPFVIDRRILAYEREFTGTPS